MHHHYSSTMLHVLIGFERPLTRDRNQFNFDVQSARYYVDCPNTLLRQHVAFVL